MNEYMTLSETADYLGKSKETLRRWDNEGKLLAVREPMSNYRVYRKSDVDTLFADFLDENIQEVIDFYYKMKEILLEEYRTNKPINYGSLGYFTHETTNKNIKKNDSKIKKTKPIPIPISKSN